MMGMRKMKRGKCYGMGEDRRMMDVSVGGGT